MTFRVTVRTPPALVEAARLAQYANRERLAGRELQTQIKNKTVQRVASIKRIEPLPDELVGGQLEFTRKQSWLIKAQRRRRPTGFVLIPNAGYDDQDRLPVFSDYGEQQYAQSLNALDDGFSYPFDLDGGKLVIKAYPSTPGNQGQYLQSATRYTTPPAEEALQNFTIEWLVSLEAGPPLAPSVVNIGNNSEKVTRFFCFFSIEVRQGVADIVRIRLQKNGPEPSSLRQAWGLATDATGSTPSQDIILTNGGGEYHVAAVRSSEELRIYFDGQLVRTLANAPEIAIGTGLDSIIFTQSIHWETIQDQVTNEEISRFFYPDTPKAAFRGYRFTPGQALYTGASFTPPTAITDLA
jgi:hypothetical protein